MVKGGDFHPRCSFLLSLRPQPGGWPAAMLWTASCCVPALSHVRLSVTPGTVAHQAPLSMGFSQARILGWVAFPSLGDLPNPGIEPVSSALADELLFFLLIGGLLLYSIVLVSAHLSMNQPGRWIPHHCAAFGVLWKAPNEKSLSLVNIPTNEPESASPSLRPPAPTPSAFR